MVALFVFTYYSLWVLVVPFLSPRSSLQSFFLPRYYSVAIPVCLLVVGLSGIAAYLGMVMVKSGKKKAA